MRPSARSVVLQWTGVQRSRPRRVRLRAQKRLRPPNHRPPGHRPGNQRIPALRLLVRAARHRMTIRLPLLKVRLQSRPFSVLVVRKREGRSGLSARCVKRRVSSQRQHWGVRSGVQIRNAWFLFSQRRPRTVIRPFVLHHVSAMTKWSAVPGSPSRRTQRIQ